MVNLLKFLLIFLSLYYGLKLVVRFVLPFLFAKKDENPKEGEVSIHKKRPSPTTEKNTKGEYIDFEEIE